MTADPPGPSYELAPSRTRDLASFGRISAELLHDLSGVLTILSGRVAVAREAAERGRSTSVELRRIQADTDSLQRMITEILVELRGADRSPEATFSVREALEGTVDRWIGSAPLVSTTLRATLTADARVAGPESFFTRTVWNLLRNAGRHARGEIRLTLRRLPEAEGVEFLVEDDGAGVEESLRDRLFQPFMSGTGAGLGLGLSFSRWAMERLGGSVEYTGLSEDLGGARFRVRAPLVRSRTEPVLRRRWEPRHSELSGGPLRTLRLALVDDEPALLSVLARVLRRAGAQVAEVPADREPTVDGIVRALAEHAPDVILLDLNLGAISGLDVLAALQEDHSSLYTRTVLLTGGTTPDPDPGRPVIHKLSDWDDYFVTILQTAGA